MAKGLDIHDPKNWVKTHIKRHEIWFCRPNLDTVVLNGSKMPAKAMLAQYSAKDPNSVLIIRADKALKSDLEGANEPSTRALGMASVTTNKEPIVVYGAAHQLFACSMEFIANNYVTPEGGIIDSNYINDKGKPKMMKCGDRASMTFDWVNAVSAYASGSGKGLSNNYLAFLYKEDKYLPINTVDGTILVCPTDVIVTPETPTGPDFTRAKAYSIEEYLMMFDNRGFGEYSKLVEKFGTYNAKPSFSLIVGTEGKLDSNAATQPPQTKATVQNIAPQDTQPQAPVKKEETKSSKNRALDLLGIGGKKKEQPKQVAPVNATAPKQQNPVDTPKQAPDSSTCTVSKSNPASIKPEKAERDRRAKYQLVGRYMNGSSVEFYQITEVNSGKHKKINRDTMCYLVGRGQVLNCKGKLTGTTVVLEGADGNKISDLPVVDSVTGQFMRNSEGLGKQRKDDTAEFMMNKLIVKAVVKDNPKASKVSGYIVCNANGNNEKFCSRDELIKLAVEGKLVNVKTQNYNGKVLMRSVPGYTALSQLPIIDAKEQV